MLKCRKLNISLQSVMLDDELVSCTCLEIFSTCLSAQTKSALWHRCKFLPWVLALTDFLHWVNYTLQPKNTLQNKNSTSQLHPYFAQTERWMSRLMGSQLGVTFSFWTAVFMQQSLYCFFQSLSDQLHTKEVVSTPNITVTDLPESWFCRCFFSFLFKLFIQQFYIKPVW